MQEVRTKEAPTAPGDDDVVLYEFHLHGFGHSDRGVRFEQMEPEAVRVVERDGAQLAGGNAGFLEVQSSILHEGACRMIREVTAEPVRGTRAVPVLDDQGNPKVANGEPLTREIPRTVADDDVVWRPVTMQELKTHPRRYFTTKDWAMLDKLYGDLHDVNHLEVAVALGKVTRR